MDDQVKKDIAQKFSELPTVVQDAITAAKVQEKLRALASEFKLHLDQWDALELEVTLTILGIQEPEDLQSEIEKQVSVSSEIAATLTTTINKQIFAPIREQLERELAHPDAKEEVVSATDTMRSQILSGTQAPVVPGAATPVVPATPPAAPPTEKAVRAPLSSSYSAQQPSTERKIVEGDPYRVPPT